MYIFETSWEVCNRVGGIYTVLSTRAATMQSEHNDQVIFLGPDWGSYSDIFFEQDESLFPDWHRLHQARVGRWKVPGRPIAVLLRWESLLPQKDAIYAWAWERYRVQSHAAYGDYDESCLFGYAAGQVVESLWRYIAESSKQEAVLHANEWQTAFCLFYVKEHCPQIGTLFTTHATSIGRSIAGNGKPLYDQFVHYNGDQMAMELNMVSKHSVEKQAAHWADCFTTVSDLTARECKQLLDKQPDIVTPNGFEPTFVPKGRALQSTRTQSKRLLLDGLHIHLEAGEKEPFMLCIAGRQEWKNKGIDVFVDSMRMLSDRVNADQSAPRVLAFVLVPYIEHPRLDMGKVTVLFFPYYLNGHDPILGKTYYELLCGMDLTVFPSYYEPWGYTPLESIAFHVPTITTNLAGFGVWAEQKQGTSVEEWAQPVSVVHRTDSNYHAVVAEIANKVYAYMLLPEERKKTLRTTAAALAAQADWKHFFAYYRKAYRIALGNI